DDMSWGIHCLLARRVEEAWPLAVQLDHLNRERREIEQGMQEEAFKAVSRLQLKDELPHGVCLYDSSWHQGVVGLVASRVKDKIHRPVIAFAQSDEETLKGSARSVHGVHIRDVLANVAAQYPAVLTKFGGHASAAGLTLRKTDLARFSDAFAAEVAKQLVKEDMCAHYQTDGALGEIELDLNVAQLLESAGPWGQGCPEPLFDGEFYVIDQRLLKGKHLKLTLRSLQTADRLISAIAFNVNGNEWPNERVECVRLIYRLSINEYQGNRTLQLVIEHLEPVYDSVPGRGGKITRTSNP
ncbi:MAG TPA: DHHA1 domain-containing protein, partial [Coxiellaceae bacterium]|nr:DHHA1 domain-containing protein [Coxiellaceae bacterium]